MSISQGQNAADLNQVHSHQYDSVVYYAASTDATSAALEKWYESVWKGQTETGDKGFLLFLDDYNPHHEFRTKHESPNKLAVEIFPPGCACKLQPLNASTKRHLMVILISPMSGPNSRYN